MTDFTRNMNHIDPELVRCMNETSKEMMFPLEGLHETYGLMAEQCLLNLLLHRIRSLDVSKDAVERTVESVYREAQTPEEHDRQQTNLH